MPGTKRKAPSPSGLTVARRHPCPTCRGIGSVTMTELQALRIAAGITQRDLAAILHCTDVFICNVEQGKRRCPAWLLAAYEALQT